MQGVFKVQILSFKIFIKPSLWMIVHWDECIEQLGDG